MMPISGTAVNGCDCPTNIPVSGVLIDGVIPSIDMTQHGTWASELFVVNRNGQESFLIGFEFSSSFLLRHVETTYFDCLLLGTTFSTVNVYSSNIYPNFLSVASANIGTFSLVDDVNHDCSSLTTLSIPLQPLAAKQFYYIEFTFGGSSVHPINWVHLAEIRFSDEAFIPPTTLGEPFPKNIYS